MPAQLLHAGRLNYDNPASRHHFPAFCHWLLWRLEDDSYVSLAVDHEDNPGPSVTNGAESIVEHATRLIRATRPVGQGLGPIRYFEAYPRFLYGELLEVDEVTCALHYRDILDPRSVYAVSPVWSRISPDAFRELVGRMPRKEDLMKSLREQAYWKIVHGMTPVSECLELQAEHPIERYLFIQQARHGVRNAEVGRYYFSTFRTLETDPAAPYGTDLATLASEGAQEGWWPYRIIDLDHGNALVDFEVRTALVFTRSRQQAG